MRSSPGHPAHPGQCAGERPSSFRNFWRVALGGGDERGHFVRTPRSMRQAQDAESREPPQERHQRGEHHA
jgi:hypothetical protein